MEETIRMERVKMCGGGNAYEIHVKWTGRKNKKLSSFDYATITKFPDDENEYISILDYYLIRYDINQFPAMSDERSKAFRICDEKAKKMEGELLYFHFTELPEPKKPFLWTKTNLDGKTIMADCHL